MGKATVTYAFAEKHFEVGQGHEGTHDGLVDALDIFECVYNGQSEFASRMVTLEIVPCFICGARVVLPDAVQVYY